MKLTHHKKASGLITYYGILQSLHLLVLTRAGFILLLGQGIPFPILPPPNGWHEQTFAFLLGLGGVDVVAILLGILYACKAIFKGQHDRRLGMTSMTIATVSAAIFGVGTFASGAWQAHPLAYWGMVAVFAPVIVLFFFLLLPENSQKETVENE